jgi:pimeloyl-ACP methyl ester carboxylesterase
MRTNEAYRKKMKPWPGLADFGRTIKLAESDLKLFYFDSGDQEKPALIMLHGLGDEADTWRHVFLPLSEPFRVLALDLPGFGRSDKPDQAYTPKFLMDTIFQFLDQLGIKRVVMMGNSLGGILSHALAIKYPERVFGLVLVDGALFQLSSIRDSFFSIMRLPILGEWLYTRLRKKPDAAYDSLRSVYQDLDSLPKNDRDFLHFRVNQRVWSDGQRRAYFSTLRNLTPWVRDSQSALPVQLSSLKTATLIIRGETDNLFPVENTIGIVSVQPNAASIVINNSKHLPHQENPAEFLEKVQPWLNELISRDSKQ